MDIAASSIGWRLQLLMEGGYFDANIDSDQASAFADLLDAELELTGVDAGEFDSKMHETGILLHIQSFSDVKVIKRAGPSPWSLPATPMDQVIKVYHYNDLTPRVRVHGTITYYQPGSAVVLQDGDKSIWISTLTQLPLRIGDAADATGFPDVHDGFINLTHGEIRDSLVLAPITPLPATWETISPKGYDSPGHHNELVSIEGRVVTQVREASQDELVLAADGKLFSAIFHHPNDPTVFLKSVPQGAKVRVTGICVLENSNPFISQVPFNMLLRGNDDITIVARPSLVNTRNLLLALGLLLVLVFVVLARGWALERKMRRQTAVMSARTEAEAELERQRSRILEDINGARPLTEILEEIAAMVSSTLGGAPCWYVAADGTSLGNSPPEPQGLRVLQTEILSRSGPRAGNNLCRAPIRRHSPPPAKPRRCKTGRAWPPWPSKPGRLYFDLRRRSEFDLLTDIPNRFAMEKFIDLAN